MTKVHKSSIGKISPKRKPACKSGLFKLAVLLVLVFGFDAGILFSDSGTTSGEIAKINPDPVTSALGGGILAPDYSPGSIFANPAAMAQEYQSKFSFSSAQLEQSINYQFAAFVIPTSAGNFTAAASLLSYGDIQGYTNSGSPYSISSSQDEIFALNYALPLKKITPVEHQFASVGVTIKGLSSSIAGYSASALAFDAGCMFGIYEPWGLSGGVALKNLGQPMNYLNTANPLPSSFDAGLKYQMNDWGNLTGILNASMASSDQLLTCSAGASVTPLYPLTLRAGWRYSADSLASGFCGGLGLGFSNVNINYSVEPFENFSMLQKVSIDIGFAGIVRPNKAYDYYLNRNFEIARDKFLRGDYIIARQMFEEILAMYPNHQPSKDYLARIAQNMEKAEQLNREMIDRYLIKGRVALQRRDVLKAVHYYDLVLGIEPDNASALDGKKKAGELRQKLEQEVTRKQNEKRIIELWSESTEYFNAADYISSKEKINELLSIDPDNEDAKKFLSQINSKLEKISSSQINAVYLEGIALYKAGKYQDAIKYFETVLLASPDRIDAKNFIDICKKKIAEQEEKARQEKAPVLDPKIKRELDASMQDALKSYDSAHYEDALKAFGDIQKKAEALGFTQHSENAKSYIAKIKNKQAQESYDSAQRYAEKGDLEAAYNEYAKALKYNPDFGSAKQEQQEAGNLLSRKYYEKGAKEFSEGNSEKAKEYFTKSLSFNKGNLESQRALDRVNSSKPAEKSQ